MAGDIWENPVTLERAVLLEAPWWNDAGRTVADLTALPGARIVGEHLHPAQHESFIVRQGELTLLRDGQRSVIRAGAHRRRRLHVRQSEWRRIARRAWLDRYLHRWVHRYRLVAS